MVKRLSTMWETRVQSLGWEDLLEKEMATHSSILVWKISWMEEPGRLQSMGQLSDFTFTFNVAVTHSLTHRLALLRAFQITQSSPIKLMR